MSSIHTIQGSLDNIVVPLLKEILGKINNENNSTKEIVENAAAKIISEIKSCPCNKEILDHLNMTPRNEKQLVSYKETTKNPNRYSYPNYSVGNIELGTGKNPNSMKWPFGSTTKE